MASLLLGAAGSALGPSLFGSVSLFGATISGAQIGSALGALAGAEIDAALMPGKNVTRSGPRLSDVNIQASTEGSAIPRLFGRMRLAGQLIWASQFKETATTTKTSSGGKGGASTTVTETDYTYSISFAVGLSEGIATRLGRVWANGNLLDLSQQTIRFYAGSETQAPDPLITDIEGSGNTPAYRGLCYVVFEDMQLADFGNRIPQLQFELIRSIGHDDPDSLENRLTGVALIPGAGEFVYATEAVFEDDGAGGSVAENVHGVTGEADMLASLDDLAASAPNLKAASLVVGWFGDNLNCGAVTIRPGVEASPKTTYPETWSVDGVARGDAHLVSQVNGRPAYGGTPSDQSVVAAIQNLKARGLKVMFCPFLFMDIAAGNVLSDPYTGASGQPVYPWRGRITCAPAAGETGSPDKTAAAISQVGNFFGGATAADFSVSGTSVAWTGGTDWGWRRMVLHYAHLCGAAGGVDAFLIGSELRGLTQVRDGATSYPAVAALKSLAAEVRAIVGAGTKIGYAADWSEYNNHQTGDAAGAVLFNLDPLWSDTNIDFIGIDNYLPLADWRDGTAHLDYAVAASIYDKAYLTSNIRGGEDYDWYYASPADRDAQLRTPITDGLGKPWVWRPKDLWGWWSNAHYDRPSGAESGTPTAWTPQSKPIWLTELGCPAIDKGANQPNVFYDPKSSESASPYYSNGVRDDLMQRRFLEAHLAFWNDAANNPVSGAYSAPMLDVGNIYLWCWDARPYPYFPARDDVWGDAANYQFGHWLNGRLGAVALGDLVGALCEDAGFTAYDVTGLDGIVTGYAVTDIMAPRDAITPLATAAFFDAVESQGSLRFVMRGRAQLFNCAAADLVLPDGEASFGYSFVRAQESDLPQVSRVSYIDGDQDYRQASVEARRLVGSANRVATSSLPLVMDATQANTIGATLLQDAWVMRETAKFALPPSAIVLDPADEIALGADGRTHRLRITQIEDTASRAIEAVATDPSLYEAIAGPAATPRLAQSLIAPGRALLFFLDLPWILSDENTAAPFVGAYADPWPGKVAVLRSPTDSNYALDATLTRPCGFGVTTADFWSGPPWRWDKVNGLAVALTSGTLSSADDIALFGGANALAVQNADGEWEIVQFANALLTGPGEYRLTGLLRGRAGSEGAMRNPVAAGARVVVLDEALAQLGLTQADARLPFNYLWGPAGKPVSDISWQGAAQTFTGAALIPLAPAHIGFSWNASGDLIISWLRRDRSPAAAKIAAAETPMSETREAYDLEILAGASAVRTFPGVLQHSQVYSAAQQAADFPSGLPNPLTVAVYQLSSVLGRGQQKKEQLYVR
ncbi:MAG TPA: glycoside hydrolase/phage tail family protein [Rhizomicrobium sp.]|nr:glycoside hydrolase/phage tail family protein [Rhizomicrobium sp.]